jgi:hypothetical protein
LPYLALAGEKEEELGPSRINYEASSSFLTLVVLQSVRHSFFTAVHGMRDMLDKDAVQYIKKSVCRKLVQSTLISKRNIGSQWRMQSAHVASLDSYKGRYTLFSLLVSTVLLLL